MENEKKKQILWYFPILEQYKSAKITTTNGKLRNTKENKQNDNLKQLTLNCWRPQGG